MKKIFIIDDDRDILYVLHTWLTKKGFRVMTFENGNSLMMNIAEHKPDLLLLDINLNGSDGRDLCREIKKIMPANIIILLFSANPSALENYKDCDADGTIEKPFELEEMENLINGYLAHQPT